MLCLVMLAAAATAASTKDWGKADLPPVVDWRTKGAVTPVQDEGRCDGSWAFALAGAIEGQMYMAGKNVVPLSAQQLMSCSPGSYGCWSRGSPLETMDWLVNSNGGNIATNASFPYVSEEGILPKCKKDLTTGATITGYTNLTRDERVMEQYVSTHGPLLVRLEIDGSWLGYTGGVLTWCDKTALQEHWVLIVGYNRTHRPPYWIIQDAWGTKWGEKGYMRLAMDQNVCGISNYPTVPILSNGVTPPVPPPVSTTPMPVPTNTMPAPTMPTATSDSPTPAPARKGQVVEQFYGDDACTQKKTTKVITTGACIANDATDSMFVTCDGGMVTMKVYSNSSTCTGSSRTFYSPENKCVSTPSGYFATMKCTDVK